MGKKKKKKKDETIVVDLEYALNESINLLMKAAKKAHRNKSVDGMVNVANGWLEFGAVYHGIMSQMEEDDKEEKSVPKTTIGFGNFDFAEDDEESEEEYSEEE